MYADTTRPVTSAATAHRGNYFITSVPPGTYVAFTSNTLGYRNEIYNDIGCTGSCSVATAVASGADVTAVGVGNTSGWTGLWTVDPDRPIPFLTWSPSPGVVFEISTDDAERSGEDLVDLAEATTALEIAAWDDIYDP